MWRRDVYPKAETLTFWAYPGMSEWWTRKPWGGFWQTFPAWVVASDVQPYCYQATA
jgi:hypothetical protein